MNQTGVRNEIAYSTISDAVLKDSQANAQDYSYVLNNYGLSFRETDAYLMVGDLQQPQGWILDLSVVAAQLPILFDVVIPLLVKENIPFKIVKDITTAQAILSGQLGYIQLGKLICIFPATDIQAFSLALELISLTASFKGPRILTDRHLGGMVYTRYGAFNPVLLTTENGQQESFIYDGNGQLIRDLYSIPFIPPTKVTWPFSALVSPEANTPDTVLKNKYKIIDTLKQDARGNVFKGLYVRKFFRITWCLIKQGRQHMVTDNYGRDIKDRLHWQLELHNNLEAFVRLPKIHDFFEQDGDSYLVMEFIKGAPLDAHILEAFTGSIWEELPLKNRLQLLDYLGQMLNMVGIMHNKGYIHRDITTVNFLVNKKDKLVMIDLELAYSATLQKPLPPFRWGTAWFMSPEQLAVLTPTIKDDIYSLGATMLALFTGLLPNKFETYEPDLLRKQLSFFLPDQALVNTIASCFNTNPSDRPDISEIKSATNNFKEKETTTISKSKSKRSVNIDPESLNQIISNAAQALSTPLMMTPNQLWFSKAIQEDTVAYYQSEDMAIYTGLHTGIGGVMLLLARLKQCGISVNNCQSGYQQGIEHLCSQLKTSDSGSSSGLYAGTAGTALVLKEGIHSGLITDMSQTLSDMQACFEYGNFTGLDIATGIAGAGLSMLGCNESLGPSFISQPLQRLVSHLIGQQQSDGSWLVSTGVPNRKATGFSTGVAGISSFLLAYADLYKYPEAQLAAIKGLNWLSKQAHKSDKQLIWYIDNQTKLADAGMNNGLAGIAFAYIKAYEFTGDQQYRQMAEKILHHYPFHFTSRNLTMANGLSGIGEVFLEAARVIKTTEMEERTSWIAAVLMHCYKKQADGSIYWILDDSPFTTADLMLGNSGAVHFLLRYCYRDKLSHPLFPNYK